MIGPVGLKRVVVLGLLATLLTACGGTTPTAATTTTPATSARPTGLGVSLAQVESFFNAHGAEPQDWSKGQNLTAAQGCTEFCGQNNEDGGTGTGCDISILGAVSNVGSIGMTCLPGQPLSAANASPLTTQALSSLLSASISQFAPSVVSWASTHLNAVLGGGTVNESCNGTGVVVTLTSGVVSHNPTVGLTIQIP